MVNQNTKQFQINLVYQFQKANKSCCQFFTHPFFSNQCHKKCLLHIRILWSQRPFCMLVTMFSFVSLMSRVHECLLVLFDTLVHSLRLQRKSEKPWIHANLHVVFYVDLQKAFDTINHEILQEKPSIMSFPTLQIHGLIIFRKQKKLVSVNSVDSETQIMRSGVPQGSVLGPSLFFINTNDLHNAISYSQPYHFADDTNLLCISNSPKKVRRQLKINLRSTSNFCFLLIKSH